MNIIKRKGLLLLTCMLFGMSVCSCTGNTDSNISVNSDSYYTVDNMSALEYRMYLAKKISTCVGQLNTHMAKLNNVGNGYANADEEINLIEASIKLLKTEKDELEHVYPPDEYLDTQKLAVKYYGNAIKKLEECKEYLQKGISKDKAIQLATELKDIYTSIQSLNH